MSKPAKPGGTVQISEKLYDVLEGPQKLLDRGQIMVRSQETQGAYWAQSRAWRGGRGPWTIVEPVEREDQ